MVAIYSVFVSVSRNLGFGLTVILGVNIWFCWMCVLFLGFCYPLWTLGMYGDYDFPSRENASRSLSSMVSVGPR